MKIISNFSQHEARLMGEWLKPDEKEIQAREIWIRYFTITEAYDRTICSFVEPHSRDAMHGCPQERYLSNAFARKMIKEVAKASAYFEITHEQMRETRDYLVKNMKTIHTLGPWEGPRESR